MENSNETILIIKYKPPGENFDIDIFFKEDNETYDISIYVNDTLVYTKEHNMYDDFIIQNNEEYEKYSYSIDEILNLTNLRRYVNE